MQNEGLYAYSLYLIAAVIISILILPLSVDLIIGFVYPFPLACCALFISKSLSSAACYIVVNKLLNEKMKHKITTLRYLNGVNELLVESPIYIGSLVRLTPVPLSAKNYGLAMLDISLGKYMICCAIGSIPFVPIVAMLGQQFGNIMDIMQGKQPEVNMIAILPTFVGLISGIVVVTKFARRILD